jgi:hypothetical protein
MCFQEQCVKFKSTKTQCEIAMQNRTCNLTFGRPNLMPDVIFLTPDRTEDKNRCGRFQTEAVNCFIFVL